MVPLLFLQLAQAESGHAKLWRDKPVIQAVAGSSHRTRWTAFQLLAREER